MNGRFGATIVATCLSVGISTVTFAAGTPPLEAFARLPNIRNVTISPDGRRIAYITAMDDMSVA